MPLDIVHGRLDCQRLGGILRKQDQGWSLASATDDDAVAVADQDGLDPRDGKPAGIEQIDQHGFGPAPERVSTDKSCLCGFLQVERSPAVPTPSDNPPTNSPDRTYGSYPFG